MLPATAEVTETTTDVRTNVDGSVTTTETSTTFNPEVRTKVLGFFETHKVHPHGLPPGLAKQVRIKEVPAAWRTTRIAPGLVITEDLRTHLVAAPPELVKVMPTPGAEVRYYMAGSNVVAIDKDYRVVDSVQIPSIKFEID